MKLNDEMRAELNKRLQKGNSDFYKSAKLGGYGELSDENDSSIEPNYQWNTWFDSIPVYAESYFTESLIRDFSVYSVMQAEMFVARRFDGADKILLYYLSRVVEEIGLRMKHIGNWYECKTLSDYTVQITERFDFNLRFLAGWISEKYSTLETTLDSIPVVVNPAVNPSLPSVNWTGSVADLAELFYRLAKAGFIDLAAIRKPEGNLLGLCRHVCQLFEFPPERREKAAKSLNAYLSQFTFEQLDKGKFEGNILSEVIGRKTNSPNTLRIEAALEGFDNSSGAE
jgi:hypothetical protein